MSDMTLPDDLPNYLRERATRLNDRPTNPSGRRVVYWMRTAVRGHENPALDAALCIGQRLGLPVLVYHAVSERYPFASDRHHRFILEGARDVAAELHRRGIAHALHVERPGHRQPALTHLAEGAAALVTEDMPWAPLDRWAARVAKAAPCAMLRVDTACLVPMPAVGRAHDRAFAFRKATQNQRAARIAHPWREVETGTLPRDAGDLPFQPVDIDTVDISALIASCAIDHTVGPIAHTPGGSRAGYARWAAFKAGPIKRYGKARNDAVERQAVSRMSPYIHYGQVSPFRLALEAAALGADKWLDEFLVWREMAHGFCRFGPDVDSLDAVPDWARESLAHGETDRRDAIYSWEALARARTHNALWNAAQTSLLRNGELHNNLRMSWGKALVGWTPDAATALDRLIDLNHRYALDGRDPNSYGGLLWCLGQFDRPFDPPTPVFGRVRGRSLDRHAERLDLPAYAAAAARPSIDYDGRGIEGPRIAVVGAGMAGAIAARTLSDHGYRVDLFDKGRGAGGRLSTRRGDPGRFDHGAQYFTARDPGFRRLVESWAGDGVVARWTDAIVRIDDDGTHPETGERARYVGTPGMSAVIKHLVADLNPRFGVEVASIAREGQTWRLADADGADLGAHDWVLLATPAPQAARLMAGIAPELAVHAAAVEVAPCWAAMLVPDRPLDPGWAGAFVARTGQPLAWAALDSAKPSRLSGQRWVLHAAPDWSAAHVEDGREAVAASLIGAFGDLIGQPVTPVWQSAHRWRHARTRTPAGADCLFDGDRRIGAAGDWCLGAKVEAAYLSGAALAGRVLNAIVDEYASTQAISAPGGDDLFALGR